jgi:hypothetical protein
MKARLSWIGVIMLVAVLGVAYPSLSARIGAAAKASFGPSPYSSLAVMDVHQAQHGFSSHHPIYVLATNATGHTRTYHVHVVETSSSKTYPLSSFALTLASSESRVIPIIPLVNKYGTLQVNLTSKVFLTLVVEQP